MYIVLSYALAALCAAFAIKGVATGQGGLGLVCAIFAAVFIWGGLTEQRKQRRKLEAEHARLSAERQAQR